MQWVTKFKKIEKRYPIKKLEPRKSSMKDLLSDFGIKQKVLSTK